MFFELWLQRLMISVNVVFVLDQFDSAPIPRMEREFELNDFDGKELKLKYFQCEEFEFELNEKNRASDI